MLKRFSIKSSAVKILLAGIYFAFFAVQLHFQFNGTVQQNTGFEWIKTDTGNAASAKDIASHKSSHSNIRLNKRYHPQKINGVIPSITEIPAAPAIDKNEFLSDIPVSSQVLLNGNLLRGPPAVRSSLV